MSGQMKYGPSVHEVAVNTGLGYRPVQHKYGWAEDYTQVTACGFPVERPGCRDLAVIAPKFLSPLVRRCRRCWRDEPKPVYAPARKGS